MLKGAIVYICVINPLPDGGVANGRNPLSVLEGQVLVFQATQHSLYMHTRLLDSNRIFRPVYLA